MKKVSTNGKKSSNTLLYGIFKVTSELSERSGCTSGSGNVGCSLGAKRARHRRLYGQKAAGPSTDGMYGSKTKNRKVK
ncbi:hypothetical protein MOD78_11945 [Bacillus haynesii]|uniref:hypothetical protein n=1 Tax=Bacillus haynesii TaxID=1925021 RepID=UPI00227FC286|nr:hypothetical protein [Bacillus haynesii]MCY7990956.1 hypothetical protein [Bacillus haynesii]MCY8550722.1 hypothetical protein [Bacillus haynesii]MCY8626326.1 hypothetical protein [Bacillus haynesii]MCY9322248.1 hypothetical protein [Bacillus haynesii]